MTNNNKIKLSNVKSSQDYDTYLRQYVSEYSVTTKIAPGKYYTKYFTYYDMAKAYLDKLINEDPLTQSIIYGISRPPHTTLPVNVTMENM